jgi:hypothetical protein
MARALEISFQTAVAPLPNRGRPNLAGLRKISYEIRAGSWRERLARGFLVPGPQRCGRCPRLDASEPLRIGRKVVDCDAVTIRNWFDIVASLINNTGAGSTWLP